VTLKSQTLVRLDQIWNAEILKENSEHVEMPTKKKLITVHDC
jgi:hypothetical protein